MRYGLCSDLGFSTKDRSENIRRVGEMAKLFLEAGVITLTALISPFRSDRERVRSLVPQGDFLEIYCRCPVTICEERDVKGLYKLARRGEIKNFTGISSPYEEPNNPELVIDTGDLPLVASVNKVVDLLQNLDIVSPKQIDEAPSFHSNGYDRASLSWK